MERTIGPFIFGRFRNRRPRFHIGVSLRGIELRLFGLGLYLIPKWSPAPKRPNEDLLMWNDPAFVRLWRHLR
jgi:hypothetical protein